MSKKVLVVENDPMSREFATRALTAGGYETVCATDGEEALLVTPDFQPDLVLMDVGLPGVDGIEAAQVLHEDPRTTNIPVVVLSALVFSSDVERAMNAGCSDYLTKPIGARELIEKVDSVLGVARVRN